MASAAACSRSGSARTSVCPPKSSATCTTSRSWGPSAAVSRGRSLRRSRRRTCGPRRQRRCRPGEYAGGGRLGPPELRCRRAAAAPTSDRGFSRTFGADRVPDRVSRCRPADRRDARHRAHDPPGPRPMSRKMGRRGRAQAAEGRGDRLPARVFNVAHQADLFNRLGGVDAAVAVLRRGRGKVYEPRLADRFCRLAPRLLSRLESEPTWDAVLSAEPGSPRWLAPDELDAVGRRSPTSRTSGRPIPSATRQGSPASLRRRPGAFGYRMKTLPLSIARASFTTSDDPVSRRRSGTRRTR